ncbi:MAG: hypothetical protein R6X22_04360 [Gemmatimonadota bacterium]|jgi:hypothetical protein
MSARFILAVATVGCVIVTGAWGARAPTDDGAGLPSAASCDFEIHARNSGSTNVYLDLYTSKVWRYTSWMKDLKMQNARVGPGVTIPPQRVTVSWGCKANLGWRVNYRKGDGSSRYYTFRTDENTRVSSSSGRRVLDLGDVGKW